MPDITIPSAALEAGKRELYPHLTTESDDMAREIARACFLAMIEAWPGMVQDHGVYFDEADNAIILPIPLSQQENTDDR